MASKRWVALLRAVNVGGRNKVPMAELRALLEAAGYAPVATFIASGNVLLRSNAPREHVAAEIEQTIARSFGVTTTAILRSAQELERVVAGHPFGRDTSSTFVTFLAHEPAAAAARALAEVVVPPEELELTGTHVYTRYPGGVQAARLTGAVIERRLGVPGTARNWRTVTKLAELAR